MEKPALLFVDGETIKIVVGKTLKCIPFKEMSAEHNVRFVDQIFDQMTVLVVDKVNKLTKESFYGFIQENQTAPATEAKRAVPEVIPNKPKKSPAAILQDARDEAESNLFRSAEETTIIVDDLPTGKDISGMPGEKLMLAIHPGTAVDLSLLPPENVKNSSILRRLIRDGKLIPCTRSEANQMEAEYATRQREDNDARLEQASPILTERAADFAAKKKDKLDINATDAETVDVSEEEPGNYEAAMFELLRKPREEADIEELPAGIEEMPQKRQLAARPAPQSSGIKAKGIGRA